MIIFMESNLEIAKHPVYNAVLDMGKAVLRLVSIHEPPLSASNHYHVEDFAVPSISTGRELRLVLGSNETLPEPPFAA